MFHSYAFKKAGACVSHSTTVPYSKSKIKIENKNRKRGGIKRRFISKIAHKIKCSKEEYLFLGLDFSSPARWQTNKMPDAHNLLLYPQINENDFKCMRAAERIFMVAFKLNNSMLLFYCHSHGVFVSLQHIFFIADSICICLIKQPNRTPECICVYVCVCPAFTTFVQKNYWLEFHSFKWATFSYLTATAV